MDGEETRSMTKDEAELQIRLRRYGMDVAVKLSQSKESALAILDYAREWVIALHETSDEKPEDRNEAA